MDYFSDINEVALSGRLTGNAKKVEPENSAPFVVVNIATNVARKTKDGAETRPEYNTVYFGEPHVKMTAQLITGDKIYVKGKLKHGEYKDKQGVSHKTVTISAKDLHILVWMSRDNKAAQRQDVDKTS
jgi:single stranded DNA-binding protein